MNSGLHILVFDFDQFLKIYKETGNPDDFIEQLMGGLNNRYNYHYSVFNRKNLSDSLGRAGCVGIQDWIPGRSELTTFADFSVWHKEIRGKKYAICLNLEATKA